MAKKVSILGCGWLGFPLAKYFVERGWLVKGSTTGVDKLALLREAGIDPFQIQLNPYYEGNSMGDFLDTEILVINIPPSLRKQTSEFHIEQMRGLLKHLLSSQLRKVVYISSTSVYPDLNREVVEEDVTDISQAENKTLFEAEELFRKEKSLDTIIIRCAGLAGYDRNLVKHFAGKKDLALGNAPVNLIYRDDVIGIVEALIEKNKCNQTYNISAPEHPLRKDLYPALANRYGFELPHYAPSDNSPFKIISIAKLQKELNYIFKFKNPMDFLYQKISHSA